MDWLSVSVLLKLGGPTRQCEGVWEACCQFIAVSDTEQSSLVFGGHFQQERADFGGGSGVEVACGFIGQQQRGLLQQCPAHGDSLSFAAGKLSGSLMCTVSQPDSFNQLQGSFPQVSVGGKTGECGEEDIFEDAALGQQLVILEDEADVLVAEGGQVAGGQSPGVLAEDFERSGGGAIESSGEIQQGAFAAAGGSADGECGAGDDFQVDC